MKNINTGIKAGHIINRWLKLRDLRHIKTNEKCFFSKKVGTFPPLKLWGWEPLRVEMSLVGTFQGFKQYSTENIRGSTHVCNITHPS